MNVSIILAHPSPGSFNHAIAAIARARLMALGCNVWWHDLYAEGFDPCLPASEIPREAPLPHNIARHIEEITTADGIVIVHPNYWSRPPAILCGWVDRVLRAGRAYTFVPDGKGGGKPVGLLKARAALVINTANTPQEKEVELYGDPLDILWRKVVFGLCGVSVVERLVFTPVITSTLAQRQTWLSMVNEAVDRCFNTVTR
ncbi:MAG TPA: NAD(P)H-dependent oxidoreductase [Verrucomicrobiota bacterium]|nr:NAD(P)H-dependent oxidoreductase [Verrucomicrobiota bacterium]HOK76308.1 NAD(P)H-dependent oxidoreductase [Verrucomicrobiota bacterium]